MHAGDEEIRASVVLLFGEGLGECYFRGKRPAGLPFMLCYKGGNKLIGPGCWGGGRPGKIWSDRFFKSGLVRRRGSP